MPPLASSRRRRGSKSPASHERSKRQRLATRGSEEASIQNATTTSKPGQNASSDQDAQSPMLTYQDAVDLVNKPIAFQIQRYKEWRQTGSVNERLCRICHQPDGLEPCHTCRMALHVRCTPQGWARGTDNEWFCPLCVQRNWHVNAPALTPPASPILSSMQDRTDGLSRDDRPSGTAHVSTITTDNSRQNTESVNSTPAQAPKAASDRSLGESADRPIQLMEANTPRQTTATNAHHAATTHGAEDTTNNRTSQEPARATRRPRKSRFTTLSSEVDASLSILYRELESITSLKTEIEELKQENAKYLQVISIRDQNLMALRRQLQNQSASDQEIEILRTRAARFDAVSREVEELRAKNTTLEADLRTSREQAATANEQLNDWKGKLSQLMNI